MALRFKRERTRRAIFPDKNVIVFICTGRDIIGWRVRQSGEQRIKRVRRLLGLSLSSRSIIFEFCDGCHGRAGILALGFRLTDGLRGIPARAL